MTHRASPVLRLVTNRWLDPILVPLLRTRPGRVLCRWLAVVAYEGRQTGDLHQLVAGYRRHGDAISIVAGTGAGTRSQWRSNFAHPWPVTLWVHGVEVVGTGHVTDACTIEVEPVADRRQVDVGSPAS